MSLVNVSNDVMSLVNVPNDVMSLINISNDVMSLCNISNWHFHLWNVNFSLSMKFIVYFKEKWIIKRKAACIIKKNILKILSILSFNKTITFVLFNTRIYQSKKLDKSPCQSLTLAVVRWPETSENWCGPVTFAKFFQ